MTDWPTAVAEFARRFDDRRVRRVRGLPGVNFMTPDLLGYVADADGTPVEITTGAGFNGERIYGMTWPRLASGLPDPRDRVCGSLDAVAEVLGQEGA